MSYNQNDMERLKDHIQRGLITVDDANVQKVLNERFAVVVNRLPAQVRKALNAAVKSGVLGHMKKDGHKPEVYYNPTFEYLARAERNMYERHATRVLKKLVTTVYTSENGEQP